MPTPTPRAPNQVPGPIPSPTLDQVQVVTGPALSFSFSLTPGQRYRLEYKDDLNQPDWMPLGDEQTALTDQVTIIDPIEFNSQRFYRVVILE